MSRTTPIFITERDYQKLQSVIEKYAKDPCSETLGEELERAQLIPSEAIPSDIVTMNSTVVFKDETNGETREVTLVYPGNSDIAQGRLSILSPVGTALLGLKAGTSIKWQLPSGARRRYRILSVTYQPEASGNLDI